jgi:hypothetical protein
MGFRRLDKERDAKISDEKRVEDVTKDKPTQTCEGVLEENCKELKSDYGTGIKGCHSCAGNNQKAIRHAECTAKKINDWCNKNFSCDQYQCANSSDIKLLGKTCEESCTDEDCCADSKDPDNLRDYCDGNPNTNEHLNDICIENVPDWYCQNQNVTWDNCKGNPAGANRFCSSREEATFQECKDAGYLDRYCFNDKATLSECKDDPEALSNYWTKTCENENATYDQCEGNPDGLETFCLNNKKATFENCKKNENAKKFWCDSHNNSDPGCLQN